LTYKKGDLVEVIAVVGITCAKVMSFDSVSGTAKVLICSGVEGRYETKVPACLLRPVAGKISQKEINTFRVETRKRTAEERSMKDQYYKLTDKVEEVMTLFYFSCTFLVHV
jgi:hypothetical protein